MPKVYYILSSARVCVPCDTPRRVLCACGVCTVLVLVLYQHGESRDILSLPLVL